MHGSTKINFAMLEEWIDRKLMDPNISRADYNRWLAVMKALLANKPQLLRRVS